VLPCRDRRSRPQQPENAGRVVFGWSAATGVSPLTQRIRSVEDSRSEPGEGTPGRLPARAFCRRRDLRALSHRLREELAHVRTKHGCRRSQIKWVKRSRRRIQLPIRPGHDSTPRRSHRRRLPDKFPINMVGSVSDCGQDQRNRNDYP